MIDNFDDEDDGRVRQVHSALMVLRWLQLIIVAVFLLGWVFFLAWYADLVRQDEAQSNIPEAVDHKGEVDSGLNPE